MNHFKRTTALLLIIMACFSVFLRTAHAQSASGVPAEGGTPALTGVLSGAGTHPGTPPTVSGTSGIPAAPIITNHFVYSAYVIEEALCLGGTCYPSRYSALRSGVFSRH